MSGHDLAIAVLVWPAVALCLVCSLGVLVMRDAYQRLHFIAPPAMLSSLLIAAAVFVDGSAAAGAKSLLTALLLLATNAVATHATARAARVRERGRWRDAIDESVPIVDGRDRR